MMISLYDPGPSARSVPRLTELCKRVLKANVSHLVDVGDVPYEMVRETLFGCRVDQLREIEALSPHIADDDEEIWQMFFKRDFPIVYEARIKQQDAQSLQDSSLFLSYRDLYNDEQIAREERLATAGNRLKERIASLKQQKEERRVVLDPRLGLDRKRKRPAHGWPMSGREYKPKTLADKARAKASTLAFAYRPPQFTKKSSMRIAVKRSLGTEPAPRYAEQMDEEEEAANKKKATHFIERTVKVKPKSSMDRPYKVIPAKEPLLTKTPVRPQSAVNSVNAGSPPAESAAITPPPPRKVIPGIRWIPKPTKLTSPSAEAPISAPAVSLTATSPPTVPASKLPQIHAQMQPSLPMLSQRKPTAPSLFIPRKRPKLS